MQQYQQIVVGGGIGGMTLAALLGLAGRKVLLLEKGPRIGGSMARFIRRGIPFDTGFHFTGGFVKDGLLADMLRVLGIAEAVRPVFIRDPRDNRHVFEDTGDDYPLPTEYGALIASLKEHFPGEETALDRYFGMIDNVCRKTVSMNLRTLTQQATALPEDSLTLAEVLNGLTDNVRLKTLLSAYAACYGVPADEVSFANHSRICDGLYRSVARVEGGGEAFTAALRRILEGSDVEVRCSSAIAECADIRARRVGRFILSSGEEVVADDCIFTIHPRKILEILPREHLHKGFVDRVEGFEPSCGLFSLFGVVEDGDGIRPFSPAIISLLPSSEFPPLFRQSPEGDRLAVIIKHREAVGEKAFNVLTTVEVADPEELAEWRETKTGRRPESYYAYKRDRGERLQRRVFNIFPEYAGRLEVLGTASMLTFRDYLNSPWGCAYGVRQKIGQINLFGRLPLRNLHAAGQSAVLPGLVGSMLASFILARALIGREEYGTFISRRIGRESTGAEL